MYGILPYFHGLKLKIDGFEINTFFESTNFQFSIQKFNFFFIPIKISHKLWSSIYWSKLIFDYRDFYSKIRCAYIYSTRCSCSYVVPMLIADKSSFATSLLLKLNIWGVCNNQWGYRIPYWVRHGNLNFSPKSKIPCQL